MHGLVECGPGGMDGHDDRSRVVAVVRMRMRCDPSGRRRYPWGVKLLLEIEGAPAPLTLPGDGSDLIAFMSFAVMRGFGAQHPLIALADRLNDGCGVRLGPITTFYDATIEDSEDREKLGLAWQEAGPLGASFGAMARALERDAQAGALVHRASAEGLCAQVMAVLEPLAAAATQGARVRLSYVL